MAEPPAPRRWQPSPLIRWSLALHGASAAAFALSPAKWPLAAGVLVLNHALLSTVGMLPRSRWLGPNLTRLPAPEAHQGHVALTFDDGPDPEVTPRVLELLATRGATASFFAIGRRADRHPELITEIVQSGHRVENHTYHHAYTFAFRSPWALGRDIDRAQQSLTRLSGRQPAYLRAPAGIRNPWLDMVLSRRGLRLASWTRRGFDAVVGDPERVTRRLLNGLSAGDILLLHDGAAARTPQGGPVVLDVLPQILDALEANGLKSIHLPDNNRTNIGAQATASSSPNP